MCNQAASVSKQPASVSKQTLDIFAYTTGVISSRPCLNTCAGGENPVARVRIVFNCLMLTRIVGILMTLVAAIMYFSLTDYDSVISLLLNVVAGSNGHVVFFRDDTDPNIRTDYS